MFQRFSRSKTRMLSCRSLFALALLLCACNDSGGGGGVNQATADVLITDAAADDLSSFSARIDTLRLLRADLTFTSDLVGTLDVEFLGLADTFALVAHGPIAAGTYVGVEIGFTPGSYEAEDEDGLPVTVDASSDTFFAALPAPLVLAANAYMRFEVDLDLADSLSGDVASGTIDFDPSGSCSSDDGSEDAPIDEIKGIVVGSDAGAGSLVIDAFAGDEDPVDLGNVTVNTDAQTLFLDDDGGELSSILFFAALVNGSTLLEVHGNLGVNGEITATRIEIEDQEGGAGSDDLVRIEGVVFDVQAVQFNMQVLEIEDGEGIAGPLLDALKGSEFIDVGFDAATVFLVGDTLAASSALAVGQEVKVKFCAFAAEPFPACRVEIEDEDAEFEGVITDVTGVSGSFVVHLDDGDPAIATGLVQNRNTDVIVDLTSSSLFLDTEGRPPLLPADLLVGLEVEPQGTISGPPAGPTIAASETKVFAGRLDKTLVQSVDEATSSFLTNGGEIVDPFGEGVTPGSQRIVVEPDCVFEGDIESAADFFEVLSGPTFGAEVRVHGIGTGNVNEIRAFELVVKTL